MASITAHLNYTPGKINNLIKVTDCALSSFEPPSSLLPFIDQQLMLAGWGVRVGCPHALTCCIIAEINDVSRQQLTAGNKHGYCCVVSHMFFNLLIRQLSSIASPIVCVFYVHSARASL